MPRCALLPASGLIESHRATRGGQEPPPHLGVIFHKEDNIFTEPNLGKLTQPLDPKRVKTREGRGGSQALSYIETHDAIRAANEIFGIGGWGYTVEELTELGHEPVSRNGRDGYRVGYRAVVRVTARLDDYVVQFSDVGYGDSVEYTGSPITPHELAAKEAVSDGVKRALKNFGSQFGLDLYSADGRADIAKRGRLAGEGNEAARKQEVWRIAKERLGKDKPSASEIAKLWGRKAGDLANDAVLREILEQEGVL